MNDSHRDMKIGFVGMRAIKTVVSVFLCFLIAHIRDASPVYSAIAAIISMKSDHKSGLKEGQNRMKGTIIGGMFGLVCLLLLEFFKISNRHPILEYLVFSLFLIPIIYSNLKIKSSSSVSLSCIVFIGIVAIDTNVPPLIRVVDRTVETFMGLVISFLVNLLI